MADASLLEAVGLAGRIFDAKDETVRWAVVGADGSGAGGKPLLRVLRWGDTDLPTMLASFDDGEIAWGAYRVLSLDNVHTSVPSKRAKIILIRWAGPNISRTKRAAALPIAAEVGRYFAGHHIDLDLFARDDVTIEGLEQRFLSTCGAFKPDAFEWGHGSSVQAFAHGEQPPAWAGATARRPGSARTSQAAAEGTADTAPPPTAVAPAEGPEGAPPPAATAPAEGPEGAPPPAATAPAEGPEGAPLMIRLPPRTPQSAVSTPPMAAASDVAAAPTTSTPTPQAPLARPESGTPIPLSPSTLASPPEVSSATKAVSPASAASATTPLAPSATTPLVVSTAGSAPSKGGWRLYPEEPAANTSVLPD